MSWARTLVGVAGLLGVGCASTCGDGATSGEGSLGELGNGEFVHRCRDHTDAACPGLVSTDISLTPDCIVEGGSFNLAYRLIDASAISTDIDPTLQVVPANTDFFGRGQPFVAQRTGRAAILVRESGHVIDLLHFDVLAQTEIEIVASGGEVIGDRIELARGEVVTLAVRPGVERCQVPGGALPLSVSRSLGLTRSVVRIEATDVLELHGEALGTTEVEVQLGELSRTLTIEVVDGPPAGTSSTGEDPTTSGPGTETVGATDTEPGTDTGAATDTDTDTDAATGSGTGGG